MAKRRSQRGCSSAGVRVNAKGVFGGRVCTGRRSMVIKIGRFLVTHGADLAIRDAKFDSTPEGWAVEGQHDEIRELLHCA